MWRCTCILRKTFLFLWAEEEAFFTRPGRNDGKALDTLDENAAEQSDKEKTTNYSEEAEAEHTEEKTEDYSDEDEVEKILDYYLDEEKMSENHGDLQSKVWLAESWWSVTLCVNLQHALLF